MGGWEDPNVRPMLDSTGALAGGAAQRLTVLLQQPMVHLLDGQTATLSSCFACFL